MKIPKSTQREQDLFSVLIYDSECQARGQLASFTVNERILINQERGSIWSQIQDPIIEPPRDFQVSEKLESKIKFILTKLKIQI